MDISLYTSRHCGLLAAQHVRCLHQALPALQPLVLVLKSLLASRGLSDGYTGGLTGYAIVLMAAAVLQHHEASLGRERSLGVGAALACFLETYSRDPRHARNPGNPEPILKFHRYSLQQIVRQAQNC